MPTFIAFKDGAKIKDLVGANPAGLQVSIYYSIFRLSMFTGALFQDLLVSVNPV